MDIKEYVRALSMKDKKTLSQKTLKLAEEVGELAKIVLPYDSAHGTNHRFTDREALLEEVADVYLTNISIAHSLGFTDEELEDMIAKKAEKWGLLQAKEEKAEFPLPYEIHVTVDLENSFDSTVEGFREDCRNIGVKPIVIDLEAGTESLKDVMTSSRAFGDNRSAYEESARIKKALEDKGYKVIRNKIETVPWHPAAPQEADHNPDSPLFHGDPIPNGCYFEAHIGVLITKKQKKELSRLIKDFNDSDSYIEQSGKAKLSRNFFKKAKDGERFVNMITYRSNMEYRENFESEVRMLERFLSDPEERHLWSNVTDKFEFEKPEIEYAIYDTNVKRDAKWMLA